MKNSIKYDPLAIYRNSGSRAKAVESLLSIKIESDLEEKIGKLMKELIESDDDTYTFNLSSEIRNIQRDIEDLKRTREINMKHGNELRGQPMQWVAIDDVQ
jgi:hypothetical protein